MTKEEWLSEFSDNLSSIMQDEGITQEELSSKSGVSKSAISKYINWQQFPSFKAIVNLAYALDCSTDDLIDFGEPID